MQAHTITLTFVSADLHQIRNFAEDLYRQFEGTRLATVQNMDTAVDRVFVDVVSSGRIRSATKVIQSCLKEHLLDTRCTITVDGGANEESATRDA